MPWKELDTVSIRTEFAVRATSPGANVSALCREFGVSRKTAYKWLKRFKKEGARALEDMSRRPKESPLSMKAEVVAEIVSIRLAHPTWGAKKLREVSRRRLAAEDVPSRSSVERILKRVGLVQRRCRRPPRVHANAKRGRPVVQVLGPNDLWTVDFKGWWLSLDKKRCEPLTVRDAYSRFMLAVDVLATNSYVVVRAAFEEIFLKYGLPKVIQTDNGPPFVASHGELGMTQLSTWWLSLNIDHVRSRPAKPSDNGGHERMHRDIASELERFKRLRFEEQQKACDQWRIDFNTERPHEALGMKCPIDVYRASSEGYARGLRAEPAYPEHFEVRTVGKRGGIAWRGRTSFVSNALWTHQVGVEETNTPKVVRIWFGPRMLGTMDFNERFPRLTPSDWVGERVSPVEQGELSPMS